jgi:hypothetical protein
LQKLRENKCKNGVYPQQQSFQALPIIPIQLACSKHFSNAYSKSHIFSSYLWQKHCSKPSYLATTQSIVKSYIAISFYFKTNTRPHESFSGPFNKCKNTEKL